MEPAQWVEAAPHFFRRRVLTIRCRWLHRMVQRQAQTETRSATKLSWRAGIER